ncbi:MAG TPA: xanthine dehydrogenase family protein molybdopterin-binding subunit [Syntrophorhabdales bacterium]|nr:xanthine dehydrogenase family protein molybdopterin-binding subunit [Syntrophorhabdales bacterium]
MDLSTHTYRVVGKEHPQVDAIEKVTGKSQYTSDLVLPGMLWGKILRSPIHHGKIKKIDTREAAELRGVRAIITGKDVPKIGWGASFGADTAGDIYTLVQDRVRFKGEEVAAVAADDERTAEEALQRIEVEYAELPAVFDPEEAILPGAPQLHNDITNNIPLRLQFQKGDVEKAFKEADVIVEDRFSSQRVHQCYMESYDCLANWDDQGRLTLWVGSMHLSGVRLTIASLLGLHVSKVRVVQPSIGGAFGSKIHMNSIFPASAILSRMTRRPVKFVYSREEEYLASRPRFSGFYKARTAARSDGTILGRELKYVYNCGAYVDRSQMVLLVSCHRSDNLYRIPALKTDAFLVFTNASPVGAYRGFGNGQISLTWELQLDMIAEKIGMDPADVRLKNATQPGDTTVHGWKITSCGLEESIKRCVALSDWKEKRQQQAASRGLGMACTIHENDDRHAPGFAGSKARVEIWEDGKVVIRSGEGDYGQGRHTTFVQIVSETLGVSAKDISSCNPDTDITPYALGPWGSRVMLSGGIAVQRAAADARQKILAVAAGLLESRPEDLDIAEGKIFLRSAPNYFVTIADAAKESLYRRNGGLIIGEGTEEPNTDKMDVHRSTNPCSTYSFATQVVEVEVNRETGQVNILKVTAGNDVGTPLNPASITGQVEGSILQGLGYGISEEMLFKDGNMVNPSFVTSGTPNAYDMPETKIFFTDTFDPYGPFGAKGGAELGSPPTPAAIANAVYNAVGVRIKDLPLTPEKILAALAEKAKKENQ